MWEYLVGRINRDGVVFLGDGWAESAGTYTLNDLGYHGWELISVNGWLTDRATAIFKRRQRDSELVLTSSN